MATPIGSTKTEEIVCIVARTKPSGYNVFSLKETSTEEHKSFQLSSHQAADLSQSLLDEFLIDEIPEYLRSSPARRVHVVVSTQSGTGLALDFYNAVLNPLLQSLGLSSAEKNRDLLGLPANTTDGNSYDLTITQDAQSIRKFAKELNQGVRGQEPGHTVILLSGDGGVVEMLNGKERGDGGNESRELPPLIAILPLGTGNALFHSLHKPIHASHGSSQVSALVLGLRTLLRGHGAPLPSFSASFSPGSGSVSYSNSDATDPAPSPEGVEEHFDSISHLYGAIVASYGFHSQLVWESDTPEYRKHGDKRFGMVAAELLKESHAYNTTVQLTYTDGSTPQQLDRDQHAYVLATMVSNLEKAFTISPASKPLDGKLRLVHFGAVSGQKTMDIMMQAYAGGKHVGMQWTTDDGKEEQVGYDEIQEVKVTTLEEDARWRKVCIDGAIVELPRGGSMVVKTEEISHLQILVDRSLKPI
ncbi:ATP-NAD kinase-like domain-containing protein [Pseudomassariella vexata]|uniref:ATP-NAD kinase-like domain-containing protein n=1 Tax=Pseudomassariella vexata TaxID=1141098 RepID=A0A1Y2DUP8_9PEZI|nr:ATP-NAD kinase-like domain-containing protein [Pseudomassariella vexata]ORY62919.1 ATP-NAD kinase-like domain-containing protein [Pseudomassariella vexata]